MLFILYKAVAFGLLGDIIEMKVNDIYRAERLKDLT